MKGHFLSNFKQKYQNPKKSIKKKAINGLFKDIFFSFTPILE